RRLQGRGPPRRRPPHEGPPRGPGRPDGEGGARPPGPAPVRRRRRARRVQQGAGVQLRPVQEQGRGAPRQAGQLVPPRPPPQAVGEASGGTPGGTRPKKKGPPAFVRGKPAARPFSALPPKSG